MLSLEDVQSAQALVQPYVRRTPLVRSASLSHRLGTNVYLKLELFQKTGSFKPRGAFNQMLRLNAEGKERGVVAVSGGNYAQGVAYASRVLGVPAIVVMPEFTPQNYVEATRAYGAEVELVPTIVDAFQRAEEFGSQGYTPIHPFDDPRMMAGDGVIGIEMLEDVPEMTDVIISIGGGGLISGIITAVKALKPEVRVWGVETEGADAMGQALSAGKVVPVHPTSLARTLGAPYVAEKALHLAQKHLEGYVQVSDREAFEAEVYLLERAKLLTELAASCTLAAAGRLEGRFKGDDHLILLLCGGNVSLENLMDYQRTFRDSGDDNTIEGR